MDVGPVGRLGGFAADHVRAVLIAWAIVAVALAAFAPKVETALSGAGWQADGSESVQARTLIQRSFAGQSSSALIVRRPLLVGDDLRARVPADDSPRRAPSRRGRARRLRATAASGRERLPRRAHRNRDGRCEGDPTAMVAAADELKSKLKAAGTPSVAVSLTGSPGMWSDFNTANKAAMMKSELLSWPVTMAIIVLAFGSLVAAGLPLLLTILGLVASAGLLSLLTNASTSRSGR